MMTDRAAERKVKATVIVLLIGAAAAAFLAANVHLVYVAVHSEPDCVPHLENKADREGQFRAAAPSC